MPQHGPGVQQSPAHRGVEACHECELHNELVSLVYAQVVEHR